jgi:hypothetical protein
VGLPHEVLRVRRFLTARGSARAVSKGIRGRIRVVPENIDETAEVPLAECPNCGGPVTVVTPVEQFIEEIPVVTPHVTAIPPVR